MRGVVRLRFTSGPLAGSTIEAREHDVLTVGRARDNAIRLPPEDRLASRHHFVLEVNPPHAVLRDLGSSQGTWVNGVRVQEITLVEGAPPDTVLLRCGDEIRAGVSEIRVEIEETAQCAACDSELDRSGRCEACATTRVEDEQGDAACVRCGRSLAVLARGSHCPACAATASDAINLPAVGPLRADTPPFQPADGSPGPAASSPFGPYEVTCEIGTGGMGAVYLARRGGDDAWVALKVLLARTAVDEDARRRFAREAHIIHQLHHPNIVHFLDRGSVGHAFYFAMELCPAGSTSQLLRARGGALGPGEAVAIAVQALEALDHAHSCIVHGVDERGRTTRLTGVVHRDVKPANILLTGSDRGWHVKLSDFGLAKAFASAGLSGCTATGFTGGSLPFMAPEQLRDFKRVGPSCDIWSLAATLYTLLAGVDPRQLRSSANPLTAILEGDVIPLRDVAPHVPAGLAQVVDSALALEIEDRPASAGWMISDLSRALYGDRAASAGVCLAPCAPGRGRARAIVALRAPRDADPRRSREVRRVLHESIVAVRGHGGLTGLSLGRDDAVVVLKEASAALELARRVDARRAGRVVPVRRALHVGAVDVEHGLPTGADVAKARDLAALDELPPEAVVLSEEAVAAMPGVASVGRARRQEFRVGADGARVPVITLLDAASARRA